MSEELENKSQGHEDPILAGRIANSGEPIRFANAQRLDGVSAHSALPGQNVQVWCRLATTSADPMFHRMVESFSVAIGHDAAQNQIGIPPYITAVVESFFSSLKKKRIRKRVYKTRDLARANVFDYIEVYYTAIWVASAPRPSNRPYCEAAKCLHSLSSPRRHPVEIPRKTPTAISTKR